MKFNKSSQLLLVSAASLLVAGLVTACCHAHRGLCFRGQLQSRGPQQLRRDQRLRDQLGVRPHAPDSQPRPSLRGDAIPVAEAVSVDYSKPVSWSTRTTTTSSSSSSATTASSIPITPSILRASFPSRSRCKCYNLFVVDTYQPLPTCSTAAPCSGSIARLSALAPPSGTTARCDWNRRHQRRHQFQYWPLTLAGNPTRRDCAHRRQRSCFRRRSSYVTRLRLFGHSPRRLYLRLLGRLRRRTYAARRLALCSRCSAFGHRQRFRRQYVYVTDFASGNVRGFSVTSGLAMPLAGSPFPAGNAPSAIVVDTVLSRLPM